MEIRPYHPNDDPYLMALERQSPRGFPKPFVHYRRRFIDRANLYEKSLTLVAQHQHTIIGVTSIALKETFIGDDAVIVGYSFDTRVHPQYRRNGIGQALVEEKLRWAKREGANGVYSFIVSTNQASLGMVQKTGYQKVRIILYLQYQPYPMLQNPPYRPECHVSAVDQDIIDKVYWKRDLYVPDLADRVLPHDYQRWLVQDQQGNHSGLSLYNQSKVSMQISADAPWPQSEAEVERLGRHWMIFDEVGTQHTGLFHTVFDWVREEAVVNNVNKITWMIDRQDPVPTFMLEEAEYQKDYWLMFQSFHRDWQPQWGDLTYIDARDL